MTAATPQRVSSLGAFGRYLAAMWSHLRVAGPLRVAPRALVIWSIDVGEDGVDKAAAAATDIIVCGSGNMRLISSTNRPGRFSLDDLKAAYPGLIDGLAFHPAVGWVLVRSDEHGSVVLGKDELRYLDEDRIEGVDPLATVPSTMGRYLKRLSGCPNVPVIVVNSTLYNAETGEVSAFEELIGCHGGAGGWRLQPFLLLPSSWTEETPLLAGSEEVYSFLVRHLYPVAPPAPDERSLLDAAPA
jgi:hypothetical protein